MYFDSVASVQKLATHTHATIFVLPDNCDIDIKNAFTLSPTEKSTITIEQVRDVIARLSVKQLSDQYIIIRPADKLSLEAANALLKNLEEPKDKIHFILITSSPSQLLPTILSRAAIYILRIGFDPKSTTSRDEKTVALAKKLITAKPSELLGIAEQITSKKSNTRDYAMEVVGTAIEILYKSYFLTNKEIFIKKLPKFLTLYENLTAGGHLKLHLVADLC